MDRRYFLALGAMGMGGAVFWHWAQLHPSSRGGQALAAPTVQTSQDGLLEVNLQAAPETVLVDGRPAELLAFNGQVPGPRLVARAGDQVRIHLTNHLHHPTNLHYHGLHISPQDNGDNVFLQVPPGERFTYEFTIPRDHPSGTFWYHPHHHGHGAEQVFGGLAGLFVIRGALDEIPEIQAAQEEFMVLQDFEMNAAGQQVAPHPMTLMRGREGSRVTVNGQVNPGLMVAQGGLLRLRFLNASAARFYRLQLEDHPFYLTATDVARSHRPLNYRSYC